MPSAQQLHNKQTDKALDDTALTACEGGTANNDTAVDHHTGGIAVNGVTGIHTGGQQDTGQSGGDAGDDEGGPLGGNDLDAGVLGNFVVAADGHRSAIHFEVF